MSDIMDSGEAGASMVVQHQVLQSHLWGLRGRRKRLLCTGARLVPEIRYWTGLLLDAPRGHINLLAHLLFDWLRCPLLFIGVHHFPSIPWAIMSDHHLLYAHMPVFIFSWLCIFLFLFTCQNTSALLKGVMCIQKYHLCILRLLAPSCVPTHLYFIPFNSHFTLCWTLGCLVHF